MLDPRVRTVLRDYQLGRVGIEDAAQALAQVHRETGCLELRASPTASPAELALIARFEQLVQGEGGTRG